MKLIKLLSFCLILFISQSGFSQKTTKQQAREENKIDTLFTTQQRWDRQLYFHDQVDKMNLSEDLADEYASIFGYHYYKMARLNDKDKKMSSQQMKQAMNEQIDKLNSETKKILTESQYKIHLETIKTLALPVYEKMGWK